MSEHKKSKLQSLLTRFGELVGWSGQGIDESDVRQDFLHRYSAFLQLLDHNRKAQQCIADIEEKLRGESPFTVQFIHRKTTEVATSTYQIISYLHQLCPGRFEELNDQFEVIKQGLVDSLREGEDTYSGPFTVEFKDLKAEHGAVVGGKMASLGEAQNVLELKVPKGFVITSSGFSHFFKHGNLDEEINRRLQIADIDDPSQLAEVSTSIDKLISEAELPPRLCSEIYERFDQLSENNPEVRVAVRSSAVGEDAVESSYAGQYSTVLNVNRKNLLTAYKSVVASLFGEKAMTYRHNRGLRAEDSAMCVGVSCMVNASCGGVVYSSGHEDADDNHVVVYSTWGLPKTVVDGVGEVDVFKVAKIGPAHIQESRIAEKEHECISHPHSGTLSVKLEEEKCGAPSLNSKQVIAVASIAMRLEKHFGTPQDIEWAYDQDGQLYTLQTRALLQRPLPPPHSDINLHDVPNAEIVLEGISSPSPGVASGRVFKVMHKADQLSLPKQTVLVVRQPLPSWAPLVGRAVAVVSETGSSAGHLASVIRERGIPALFGVKNAMSILMDEQLITVDSINKHIYRGDFSSTIESGRQHAFNLTGSPVHVLLKKAAVHVVPLHLLDPDSVYFQVQGCRSMHDLVRFCHEKAVLCMFNSSNDTRYPERLAKQLVCKGRKQFWILNLGDGFKQEVEGDTVELDNITSSPMHAVWQGMHAIPWRGPPSVNARGLMSVMFEATANPSLDPALFSAYSLKNYFMVSKHYVSLQSRFGFHFCGVEALIGERKYQNYVTFRFQGGAADERRRELRSRMIEELLESYDFRVKRRGDSLSAKAEGFDASLMEEKLRIVGYLITHTRQLDMVMKNQAEAESYKKKIERDLTSLVSVKC